MARQTIRSYIDKDLPRQVLSNLMWAAFGVNRKQGPRGGLGRTAPSAVNAQEIDLYVAASEGLFLYDAASHTLKPVLAGDLRGKLGPAAAAKAGVTIIYVADYSRYGNVGDAATRKAWANAAAGFIGQNVYLFADSEGLGAWFRAMIPEKENLAKTLKLRSDQEILYVQTVGYPALQ